MAIWAPNSGDWVIAALGAFRAGAVVITVNTRFKGGEAAHVICAPPGPDCCVTITDFLDTDYVALLAEAGDARLPRARPWSCAARCPTGRSRGTTFLAAGGRGRPATVAARAADDRRPTT